MKQSKLHTLYEKDMTKKILASLLSILIGLVVGSIIIAAVCAPSSPQGDIIGNTGQGHNHTVLQ